jgi:hypothetical protein
MLSIVCCNRQFSFRPASIEACKDLFGEASWNSRLNSAQIASAWYGSEAVVATTLADKWATAALLGGRAAAGTPNASSNTACHSRSRVFSRPTFSKEAACPTCSGCAPEARLRMNSSHAVPPRTSPLLLPPIPPLPLPPVAGRRIVGLITPKSDLELKVGGG